VERLAEEAGHTVAAVAHDQEPLGNPVGRAELVPEPADRVQRRLPHFAGLYTFGQHGFFGE
jgi:hypothetical protein